MGDDWSGSSSAEVPFSTGEEPRLSPLNLPAGAHSRAVTPRRSRRLATRPGEASDSAGSRPGGASGLTSGGKIPCLYA